MKSMKVFIQGMHCRSCEALVRLEFKKISQLKDVKVDLKTSSATLYYEKEAPLPDDLNRVVNPYGYTVTLEEPPVNPAAKPASRLLSWIGGGVAAGALLLVFYLLQQSGIIDIFQPDSSALSVGMAVLLGVIASLSSCFAVVGSLVIALGSLYGTTGGGKPAATALKANLIFHAGRLLSFFLLGGILGWIGGSLSLSGRFYGIYMAFMSLLLLLIALRILGINKLTASWGWKMPAFLFKGLAKLKNSRNPLAPFLSGALSFFLPCGFTQSLQVAALGAGSFLAGSSLLFFFALGTLPVLLLAGITTAWLRFRGNELWQKATGLLLVAFALYLLSSALPLLGYKGAVLVSGTGVTDISTPAVPDNQEPEEKKAAVVQDIEMHVTYAGFQPPRLKVKAGIPVRWTIYGDDVTGCTNRIIIPMYRISAPIPGKDKTIIEFTPTRKGDIPYSCWMGMYRGVIVAE